MVAVNQTASKLKNKLNTQANNLYQFNCLFKFEQNVTGVLQLCTDTNFTYVCHYMKGAYFPTMPDDSLFHAMNTLTGAYYCKYYSY